MAAKSAWRQVLSWLPGLVLAGPACAQDTTFLSGEELAARLRQNLVWIAAQDIGEHGYGLVVGGDAQTLWVLTARHVVVRTGMRGSSTPETPSRQIRLRFCTANATELLPSEPWPDWDADGEDIALLSVARPRDYQPVTRALAPQVVVGEPVWLLGSNDECSLVPAQGQVRVLTDATHNLRIDFPGVQGGSSGAPVLSGSGVLGLMKSAEDLTTTVHAIDDLQRRLQALPGHRWELVEARNIPPTDPRAAEIDLAETLNQYLLVLRNVHMLLQQRQVARPTLDDYMQRYNLALRRFLRVREAYDGSLNRYWPPPVSLAWRSLRETLWTLHQNFWRINPLMEDIYKSQQSSDGVRAQMASLEPGLVRLESDIAQFLRLLAKEN
ncbi:S1 family peptidase [Rhodoferax sp. UBA5149]|uniref:S1 family peptidase n=1 Tax=Rhodoferax sp. UBA5149 TaxID=1947379 RepID=UPI0025DFD6CC|nr:serine protease [Rhodoferax sp. UBA5149]